MSATIQTQNQRINSVETLLQESQSSSVVMMATPQAANRRVRLIENADASPRPQHRTKYDRQTTQETAQNKQQSPSPSPQQVSAQNQQRSPLCDFTMGLIQRVVAGPPRSINEAISSRAIRLNGNPSAGNDASPTVSKVILELVKSHQLGQNVQYSDTIPPPSLFPGISSGKKNVYKWTMKVVKKVITAEQDTLFREASASKDPDLAAVGIAAAELDRKVVVWLLEKEGAKETNKNNRAFVNGSNVMIKKPNE